MYIFSKWVYSLLLIILSGYLMPLNATNATANNEIAQQQQYVQQPVQPNYPPYGTTSEYYYNQNNPYSNPTPPNYYNNNAGFYGGFYGSPPPPGPTQVFPDKAASDNLYRYIQSR